MCIKIGPHSAGRFFLQDSFYKSNYISEHENEMADAARHDEQMEDFVRAEISVLRIENRKLQRIDDAAYGVEDAAGQKPQKGAGGKQNPQVVDDGNAGPSHCDI